MIGTAQKEEEGGGSEGLFVGREDRGENTTSLS